MRISIVANRIQLTARVLSSYVLTLPQRLRTLFSALDERTPGKIIFAEKTFSIDEPIQLTARIDRAYGDGSTLTLLELKSRPSNQVFLSDVI